MPIINFPPVFDPNYYRRAYPELNLISEGILIEHYKRFAVEQGRSTCFYDRREYLQQFLQRTIDEKHLKALEISPWDNPFLRGERVKYFDVIDAESLQKTAAELKRPFKRVPKKIDFVGSNGDLSIIEETFDLVFSSHVIEHVPDLIEHFQNVRKILNPGGLYVLIIPDKRYCFDHYNPESNFSEVLDAFVDGRKIPRLADVINLVYTRTHNSPVLHWLGEHGKKFGYRDTPLEFDAKINIMDEVFFDDGNGLNREQILLMLEKYVEAVEKGEYISTHNWRFTPDSFDYIVNLLNALEFINLPIYRLCHTIFGRLEFVAILEKN